MSKQKSLNVLIEQLKTLLLIDLKSNITMIKSKNTKIDNVFDYIPTREKINFNLTHVLLNDHIEKIDNNVNDIIDQIKLLSKKSFTLSFLFSDYISLSKNLNVFINSLNDYYTIDKLPLFCRFDITQSIDKKNNITKISNFNCIVLNYDQFNDMQKKSLNDKFDVLLSRYFEKIDLYNLYLNSCSKF